MIRVTVDVRAMVRVSNLLGSDYGQGEFRVIIRVRAKLELGLGLKRHCIEFGVVRIDSAIVVRRGAHTLGDNSAFVNSAGQLLLPGGARYPAG